MEKLDQNLGLIHLVEMGKLSDGPYLTISNYFMVQALQA